MASILFRVAMALSGSLLLYVGLFLTETEEGKLKNRLETLWVAVDDLQSRAMNRQAAFLQQVSILVEGGFVKLFGQKLFSLKSVATCLCLAIASLYLSLALFGNELPILTKPWLVLCSLTLLLFAISPLRYLSFAVLALGIFFELRGLRGELKVFQGSHAEIAWSALVYVITIFSAIAFVALTRWSLRVASHLSKTLTLIAILLANVTLGAALVGPPIFVKLHHYQIVAFGARPQQGSSLVSPPHGILSLLYDLFAGNLFTAFMAFLMVFAALAALLHKLVWPVISRTVYAAHRHGLIAQHKLLAALGASFWLLALPNNIVLKAIGDVIR